jgi:hypothetical protein
MTRRMLFVIAVSTAAAGTARADDDHALKRALARTERAEPTVKQTVAAALRHAGLAGRPEVGVRRRARLAAALPTLSLRARRDTSWDEASDDKRVTGDIDQKVVLEARATWRLDRLVFDGTELRALALGQQRARARAALSAQTTALYYRRRAAQVDDLWSPAETAEGAVRRELAIAELSAQLDALTGGWWSEQVR